MSMSLPAEFDTAETIALEIWLSERIETIQKRVEDLENRIRKLEKGVNDGR